MKLIQKGFTDTLKQFDLHEARGEMMGKEQRARKFISSWTQIRIAVEVLLHGVLMISLLVWILFAPPFVTSFSSYGVLDHQAVAKELFNLNVSKWPLFILLAIFIGMVTVLFSHHIVGPAFHIKRILRSMLERDLNVTVRFRKWDYLVDIEEDFNKTLQQLRQDFQAISQETENAISLYRDIKTQVGNSPKSLELEKTLQSLSTQTKNYKV